MYVCIYIYTYIHTRKHIDAYTLSAPGGGGGGGAFVMHVDLYFSMKPSRLDLCFLSVHEGFAQDALIRSSCTTHISPELFSFFPRYFRAKNIFP